MATRTKSPDQTFWSFKFPPSCWARLVLGSDADLGWQARSPVREDSVPTSPCAPGRACSRAGDWLRVSPGGSCSRAQGRYLALAPGRAAPSSHPHLFFPRSWGEGREAPGGGMLPGSAAARAAAERRAPPSLARSLALSPPSPRGEFSRLRCCNFPPAEAAPRLAARTHASARRGAGGC